MDWVSFIFFSFVSLISRSVLFFSGRYMNGHTKYRLFIVLVIFFILRIFFLVFRLNLISIILGWDGLGVVSYILVIFYRREKSNRAGIITALRNRIGDAALLLAIACFLEAGRWNYIFIVLMDNNLVILLIRLAAITKRAQIPFSAWLPAAIAAPTPVRALVHSSTLVTAGVYLLIRFRGLLKGSLVIDFLIYLGVLTTLIASVAALFEADFKKVVALSTLSQLGVIVRTLAIGLENLAFIHLLAHAIFKALLFICRGKIIHIVEDSQNIRKIGGIFFNLPLTGIFMGLSSFALCGVPFIAGFYSKDIIIERMEIADNFFISYIIYIIVVGLSASYSFRLIFLRVIDSKTHSVYSRRRDKDWVMLRSKIWLGAISILGGALLLWLVVPTPVLVCLRFYLKILSFVRIRLGFFTGLILCFANLKGLFVMRKFYSADIIITLLNLSILRGRVLGWFTRFINVNFKKLDLGWGEIFGGFGTNKVLLIRGLNLNIWFSRSVKIFLVIFFVGVLICYRWWN